MNPDETFWHSWHPATNGAVRGWWLSKGESATEPAQALTTRDGRRLITFKTLAAAKKRCRELNAP